MNKFGIAVLAGLSALAATAMTAQADNSPPPATVKGGHLELDKAHLDWVDSIHHSPVSEDGCFQASFPSLDWKKVTCVKAPNRPFLPHSNTLTRKGGGGTTGDGKDYAVEAPGYMSAAIGSFPKVTGVTSEKDGRTSNSYTLQLNSNFMTTAVCNGTKGCQSWEQFVYSAGEKSAFMQYWLISYGATCPSGWNTYSSDCYKNSAAVSVPQEPISGLSTMSMSATAVSGGKDTLIYTDGSQAYTTNGLDTVVDLASGWEESEFNIVGDGGGSEATFNTGVSITVKVAITDGSTAAPACPANAGTTGETVNLTLGSCTASGGSSPSITFTESN